MKKILGISAFYHDSAAAITVRCVLARGTVGNTDASQILIDSNPLIFPLLSTTPSWLIGPGIYDFLILYIYIYVSKSVV